MTDEPDLSEQLDAAIYSALDRYVISMPDAMKIREAVLAVLANTRSPNPALERAQEALTKIDDLRKLSAEDFIVAVGDVIDEALSLIGGVGDG